MRSARAQLLCPALSVLALWIFFFTFAFESPLLSQFSFLFRVYLCTSGQSQPLKQSRSFSSLLPSFVFFFASFLLRAVFHFSMYFSSVESEMTVFSHYTTFFWKGSNFIRSKWAISARLFANFPTNSANFLSNLPSWVWMGKQKSECACTGALSTWGTVVGLSIETLRTAKKY